MAPRNADKKSLRLLVIKYRKTKINANNIIYFPNKKTPKELGVFM